MSISLPQDVSFILKKLQENDFSAFIVGGCVRDALLKKTPTDWDICTNALPDETISIFSDYKIVKTGIKHGTITLILNSVPYEITTFRTDGDYLDSRHPQNVKYIRNIDGDLSRRDFTINAMAYNEKIVDLYGGQVDLEKKIIRCVGNAKKRFSEDALRIMRAIRFSATLDFKIENETKKAIFLLKSNLSNIAIERINTEFSKILLSDSKTVYNEFAEVFDIFLNGSAILDENFGKELVLLPKDIELRLAFLMIYIKSDNAKEILLNLRYPSKIINNVLEIIKYFNYPTESIKDLRILLSETEYETVYKILTIKNMNIELDILVEIKEKKLCSNLSQLSICGDDLISIGINNGILIGNILKQLLYLVIEEKCENEKKALINEAKKLMEEWK